jgi:hypothetical protein
VVHSTVHQECLPARAGAAERSRAASEVFTFSNWRRQDSTRVVANSRFGVTLQFEPLAC